MNKEKSYDQLLDENRDLKLQLEEATDTIFAIRSGQIDALVVKSLDGHQLYTLKSSDHTYRIFIEKMNEGAVTLNKDRTILYSNSKFARLVNIPLDKVIGSKFDSYVFHQSHQNYHNLIEEGWIVDSKAEILLNNDNTATSCLISCNAMDLEDGKALSLIITDLTSQKATQNQLIEQNKLLEDSQNLSKKLNDELEQIVRERTSDLMISREHFKFLANNIPVFVWTANAKGELDYYNSRWYEYTGLTFEETLGWGWQPVIHPDDLESTLQTWKYSLETGHPYEMEYRLKRSDGVYRWYLGYAIAYKNDNDEIVTWFGTNTDIEDQKKALEIKDEFIGIASHELKTPLTSLKGYLQIISSYKKEEVPAIVKDLIGKANVALNKLQGLVSDLLDVSKINAGRLDYNREIFNISELVEYCIENSNHIYPDFQIEKSIENNLFVHGNAERLEQVLMNLISNAVKYSSGNKDMIVSVWKNFNEVLVSVTDFGIGLLPEQKEKIFERFYRVEDKKFLASGLGMGLFISAEIIKDHDGELGVDSNPGAGSTFYFKLPLIQQ
ncbi:PAS domain-containing sensor histidine kinase [Daejeonella oryzae]|uniref:PAS domain-containing sensor histidine kinase n=1 Tax=Daejeonella oryzae TaxID=1122943 RepID=UPI0004156ED3|nr:ATP-binding protein [Daejeonella oryzae]